MFIRFNCYAHVGPYDDFCVYDTAYGEQTVYAIHLNRRNRVVRITNDDRFPELRLFACYAGINTKLHVYVPVTFILSDVCNDEDVLIPLSITTGRRVHSGLGTRSITGVCASTYAAIPFVRVSARAIDLSDFMVNYPRSEMTETCTELNEQHKNVYDFKLYSLRISFEFQDWLKRIDQTKYKVRLLC